MRRNRKRPADDISDEMYHIRRVPPKRVPENTTIGNGRLRRLERKNKKYIDIISLLDDVSPMDTTETTVYDFVDPCYISGANASTNGHTKVDKTEPIHKKPRTHAGVNSDTVSTPTTALASTTEDVSPRIDKNESNVTSTERPVHRETEFDHALELSKIMWDMFINTNDNILGHWKRGNVELNLIDMFRIGEAFFPLRHNIVKRFKSLLENRWDEYCKLTTPLELLYREGIRECLMIFVKNIPAGGVKKECIMHTFCNALREGDLEVSKMLADHWDLGREDICEYNDFWAVSTACRSCLLYPKCLLWFAGRFMFCDTVTNERYCDVWTKFLKSHLFGMAACMAYFSFNVMKNRDTAKLILTRFYGGCIQGALPNLSKLCKIIFRLEVGSEGSKFSRWFVRTFIRSNDHCNAISDTIDSVIDSCVTSCTIDVQLFNCIIRSVELIDLRTEETGNSNWFTRDLMMPRKINGHIPTKTYTLGTWYKEKPRIDGRALYIKCFLLGLYQYAQCIENRMADIKGDSEFLLLVISSRTILYIDALRWMIREHKHIFDYISRNRYRMAIQNIVINLVRNVLCCTHCRACDLARDILTYLVESMKCSDPREAIVWYAHVDIHSALASGSVEFVRWYTTSVYRMTQEEIVYYQNYQDHRPQGELLVCHSSICRTFRSLWSEGDEDDDKVKEEEKTPIRKVDPPSKYHNILQRAMNQSYNIKDTCRWPTESRQTELDSIGDADKDKDDEDDDNDEDGEEDDDEKENKDDENEDYDVFTIDDLDYKKYEDSDE